MRRDRLMTLNEVCAEVLHCSYAKGLKLMRTGALPGAKVGSTYAIPRNALYAALGLEFPAEGDDDEQ